MSCSVVKPNNLIIYLSLFPTLPYLYPCLILLEHVCKSKVSKIRSRLAEERVGPAYEYALLVARWSRSARVVCHTPLTGMPPGAVISAEEVKQRASNGG